MLKIPFTLTISSTCLPVASPLQEQVDALEIIRMNTNTQREDKSQSCHPDFQMKWGIRMEVKAC